MKKIKIIVLVMLCAFLLAGCQKAYIPGKDDGKINIVCTTFPQYDWTMQLILGAEDKYNVRYLLAQGTDMHSYQPTVEDVVMISECDLLIYGGGESESWVVDAINDSDNKNLRTICLMETIGLNVRDEVHIEGMQEERGEDHDHAHDHENVIEGDEHIWLSLNNAKLLVAEIESELEEIDKENIALYRDNLDNYVNQINVLDAEYKDMAANATHNLVLFGDRFPFLYLMEDYNLRYYAAFSGCSAETEASFETITFLAEKLDEYNLPCVLIIESSDGKLANTIIDSSNDTTRTVVRLHAMQSVTKKDISNGTTYLSLMRQNLEALKKALL